MQNDGTPTHSAVRRSNVGVVSVLTLDNPEGHAALDRNMIARLVQHLDEIEADDTIRAVVLTGTGRFFCTGASLARLEFATPAENQLHRDGGGILTIRIFEFAKPIVVALNGDAVGVGASMLLPCDVRLSVPSARVGFVQARRGIALEGCSSWFLPRIVGINRAVDWAVSGRLVAMDEAMKVELIHSVHAPDELLDVAIDAATILVEKSAPVSAAVTRRMLWNALSLTSPMEAHQIESVVVPTLMKQADAKEGVSAFFQRRPASFADTPSSSMRLFSKLWKSPPFDAS